MLRSYREFNEVARWEPRGFVLEAKGYSGPGPLISEAKLYVLPANGRLAVLRREVE